MSDQQSNTPRRVQRKRTKGWKMPENTVYVGRPSKWGNPVAVDMLVSVEEAVRMYRDLVISGEAWWTTDEGTRWEMRNRLTAARNPVASVEAIREELVGKNLACWCLLDQPCHADVLIAIANDEEAGK